MAKQLSFLPVGGCCTLIDLVKARFWRKVWERMQSPYTCSSELTVVDDLGQCALHYAVINSAPPSIIRIFISDPAGRTSALFGNHEGEWTPLHLACRNAAPDETIVTLAVGVPSTVPMRDIDGDTVLHSACRYGASDYVLQTLIGICNYHQACAFDYPGLLHWNWNSPMSSGDIEGDLPIHSAVQHEVTADIISCLLEANPRSFCALNNEDRSPLHLACACGRDDVIARMVGRLLDCPLQAKVQMFLEVVQTRDQDENTPISLLWSRLVAIRSKRGEITAIDMNDQIEIWKSIVLILAAASRFKSPHDCRLSGTIARFWSQMEDEDSLPNTLLHAAIIVGNEICPPQLLQFFVQSYPDVLSTPDEHGRLPLHYAATATTTSSKFHVFPTPSTTTWLPKFQDQENSLYKPSHSIDENSFDYLESGNEMEVEEEDEFSRSYSVHDIQNAAPFPFGPRHFGFAHHDTLRTIAKAHPGAAKAKDNCGRLPLHAAIAAGASWRGAVETIFEAEPSSLQVPDGPTGLMPFMLASCVEARCDLDLVYNLLLSGPDLIIPL